MPIATTNVNGELKFMDQSEDLKKEDPSVYELVQSAMRAGLTDFITPTTANGEGRIEWGTRQWVTMRKGKLVCFMVAFRVVNAHFEVVGPEVATPNTDVPAVPAKNALREIPENKSK